MCCKYYYSDKTVFEVKEDLKIATGAFVTDLGDITPGTTTSGIICNMASGKEISFAELFWGIRGKDGKLIINARSEEADKKPMFADSLRLRRCILPAAGFYEWDRDKTRFTFRRQDNRPIYLAGVYDLSDNRDSFVILTTAANESMRPVHDRMPVMIEAGAVRDFLGDPAAAMDMIKSPMPELKRDSEYEQLRLF